MMRDSTKLIALTIALLLATTAFGAGAWMVHTGYETKYQYEVKSEQVETDAGYNGSAVAMDSLSGEYQDAVFDAYKQADHFLGGASAHVTLDEPMELTDDDRWQVVSIEGVHVLVGVTGPEEIERASGAFLGMLVSIVSAFLGTGIATMLIEEYNSQ